MGVPGAVGYALLMTINNFHMEEGDENMKKLVGVLIFIMISLALISSTKGGEPTNFGKFWNEILTDSEKEVYVSAFVRGFYLGYDAAISDWAIKEVMGANFDSIMADRSTRRKLDVGIGVLVRQVTELYKDPANTYIPVDLLIYIAADRIAGEYVEDRLQGLRKEMLKENDK